MKHRHVWTCLLVGAVLMAGCRNEPEPRPYREPPPAGVQPTVIDYVDADGFDALFESTLVNQDPVILVRTGSSTPDWGGRLNAWLAAWNRGGKVREGQPAPTARGQSPVPRVVIDGESVREFRLLVSGLMDRVEDLARNGSAWWAEERVRARRVALLRPYSLRFHMADDATIHLIFFNGNYARHYGEFMQALTDVPGEEWSRSFECSLCRHLRYRGVPGKLTSRAAQ